VKLLDVINAVVTGSDEDNVAVAKADLKNKHVCGSNVGRRCPIMCLWCLWIWAPNCLGHLP
jgi:hypothetical protein